MGKAARIDTQPVIEEKQSGDMKNEKRTDSSNLIDPVLEEDGVAIEDIEDEDDMLPEYDFSTARRNPYAERLRKQKYITVRKISGDMVDEITYKQRVEGDQVEHIEVDRKNYIEKHGKHK